MLALVTTLLEIATLAGVHGPKIIAAAEGIWDTWTVKEPPTAAEIAAFNEARAASHKAVQDM